jgi:hypothetical protein
MVRELPPEPPMDDHHDHDGMMAREIPEEPLPHGTGAGTPISPRNQKLPPKQHAAATHILHSELLYLKYLNFILINFFASKHYVLIVIIFNL